MTRKQAIIAILGGTAVQLLEGLETPIAWKAHSPASDPFFVIGSDSTVTVNLHSIIANSDHIANTPALTIRLGNHSISFSPNDIEELLEMK